MTVLTTPGGHTLSLVARVIARMVNRAWYQYQSIFQLLNHTYIPKYWPGIKLGVEAETHKCEQNCSLLDTHEKCDTNDRFH